MRKASDDKQSRERGKVIPFHKDELSMLRSLLMSKELSEIEEILVRLDDPETRAREIARILPVAVAKRGISDKDLAAALGPTVEDILRTSVKRNPQALVDALFPVMGPAMRKSIAEFFRGMMQGLDRALQHGFSLRGLKWRLEALKTGKPFTEIVLLHSLVFRVEQVFLIHRETGLLLRQVKAESVVVEDPDTVAGMMTAIQDFVKDSFHTGETEGLENLRMGDLTVIVEQGPLAYLAAIVRGIPPSELQDTCKDALERVHLDLGEELEKFDGDPSAFAITIPRLEACLVDRYREEATKKPFSYARLLLLAALIPAAYWVFAEVRETLHWRTFIDNLRATKGIVVTSTGEKNGKYTITGLRDPLARDPQAVAVSSGIDSGRLSAKWESFYASDPEFVLSRAKQALSPPDTVTLTFDNGVLKAAGSAPFEWARDARMLSRVLVGVNDYRDRDLVITYDAEIARFREALVPPETVSLSFRNNTLVVGGLAPYKWAMEVRNLARLIPGVDRYDDGNLTVAYDEVLKKAQDVLAPPATVEFNIADGVLTARGRASTQWITEARRLAGLVPGVSEYKDAGVVELPLITLKALRKILNPPDTITMELSGGVLWVSGSAPHGWITETRARVGRIPGLDGYRERGLKDLDVERFQELTKLFERTVIHFERGSDRMVPGQDKVVSQVVSQAAELQKLAGDLKKRVSFRIIGHTDAMGNRDMNLSLSKSRADKIADILENHGIAHANIVVGGVGSLEPLSTTTSGQERALSRRVTFGLTFGD
ncbi:MAG: OmpA family protein [Pseudomonadota bacterium]